MLERIPLIKHMPSKRNTQLHNKEKLICLLLSVMLERTVLIVVCHHFHILTEEEILNLIHKTEDKILNYLGKVCLGCTN